MKVALYSAKSYDRKFFEVANQATAYSLKFISQRLNSETVSLSQGCEVVCCFVTDCLNKAVLEKLHHQGVVLIALRSAGYDHVDLQAAKALGLAVVRVPAYSPQAIAEFAAGLLLALSRKITLAHDKVRAHNFSLEGQVGFNLAGKTVGIIGTGFIGSLFAKIMKGFGCQLLAFDPVQNEQCQKQDVVYTDLTSLFKESDIISLHCLLNQETRHVINHANLDLMKTGVVLINTARGGLIDTAAVIDALESGKIGALGLDVYEKEQALFFEDHRADVITDEVFLRLQSFSNVIITGHQAYLSEEALTSIAKVTLENIAAFVRAEPGNAIL